MLEFDQYGPHLGDCGDDGGGCANLMRFQRRIVEGRGVEVLRGADRGGLVFKVYAPADQGISNSAIDHAGIEMMVAVVRGQPLGECPLAGGRRSVDRDNHEKSAPSARIIGMKSGKLVAMKAVSSTLTGLSEASPITSADIAIR